MRKMQQENESQNHISHALSNESISKIITLDQKNDIYEGPTFDKAWRDVVWD